MATATIELRSTSELILENSKPLDALPTGPEDSEQLQQTALRPPQHLRAILIVITVTGTSFLNSLGSGFLTVGIQRIAEDIQLAEGLLLWPASVFPLATACTLLPAGAVADVVGNRPVFLTGGALLAAFTLGCALAQTGIQLILFRAFQGVAMSLCLPTAVGIISTTFPPGTTRNIAFGSLGGGQPVGFALGLVLGGVLVDSIGWRYGYYLALIFNALIFCAAVFTLPKSRSQPNRWHRVLHDLDWVGAVTASTSLGVLSYVFAGVTSNYLDIREPANIALLSSAIILIPCFIFWVGRQEKLGRPAIIPNSLWRRLEFTSVCITVFLTWAMFDTFCYFVSLLFQVIEHQSATQASLRILPVVIIGLIMNILTGILVNKASASILVLGACSLSAVSPLVFALLSPKWSYWVAAFPAMCLVPISSDVLFTLSNLVITAAFPDETQALAGSVFNTVAQLGNSLGLAATAMLASGISASKKQAPEAVLEGYRAAFWMCFAAGVVACVTVTIGLRKSGKVGLKRD